MAQVLLVESEPQLSLTARALEDQGWNVLVASNAASCMRVARQDLPDIAVVAARLEQEDGAPLVQRLRALLRTAVTPILGLTDGADEAREMLAAGAQECLQRPVAVSDLYDALSRHSGRELSIATAPSFVIEDPKRLEALDSTGLLDSLPEEDLDRFTRLASRFLDAPTALISLVGNDRQFFKSALGLTGALEGERQTPLSHSYCQWAVATQEPFVVPDARLDPIIKSNPAIEEYDAISYCGIPIMVQGEPIGTLCVVDSEPRPWSDEQVSMLQDLAGILSSYLELKAGLAPTH